MPRSYDPPVVSAAKERGTHQQLDHTLACRRLQSPQAGGLGLRQLHARHLVELASNPFDESAEIFGAHSCRVIHGRHGCKMQAALTGSVSRKI